MQQCSFTRNFFLSQVLFRVVCSERKVLVSLQERERERKPKQRWDRDISNPVRRYQEGDKLSIVPFNIPLYKWYQIFWEARAGIFFRFYQLARYFINLLAQALLLAFSFLSLAAKKLQRDMLICLLSLVFPQYFSGFIHFRELSKLLNAKWLVTKISTQWKRRRNWSIFSKYATFSPERITLHRFFGTQSRSSCNMASMLKLEPQFALTGRYDYLWRCLSQKCAHCNKVTRFLKFETVKYIIYISYSWLLKLAAHGDYIENVTNQLREDRFPACDYISNANCAQGSGLRGPTTLELSIERAVEIVLGTYSNRYCLNRQNRVRWTIRWERWPGAIWPSSWVVHPRQGLKLVSWKSLLGNFLQSTYIATFIIITQHI